jgi:hypothetical protein
LFKWALNRFSGSQPKLFYKNNYLSGKKYKRNNKNSVHLKIKKKTWKKEKRLN